MATYINNWILLLIVLAFSASTKACNIDGRYYSSYVIIIKKIIKKEATLFKMK